MACSERWGFLAAARKLAEEWRLEPEVSLPREALVVAEPSEATETERGDISRSARSAPKAAIGLNSGGGVWERSGWVAAMVASVGLCFVKLWCDVDCFLWSGNSFDIGDGVNRLCCYCLVVVFGCCSWLHDDNDNDVVGMTREGDE